MQVRDLGLAGVVEIDLDRFGDARGFFSETWNAARFRDAGIDIDWVQDNHSLSVAPLVLRGLHYQMPPMAQDKLVRVVRGAIFDVAVDIRHGSPDFGKWVATELSSEKWNQILVPKGFAHGFLTLQPDTEVIYKVSAPYSPRARPLAPLRRSGDRHRLAARRRRAGALGQGCRRPAPRRGRYRLPLRRRTLTRPTTREGGTAA